MTSLARAVHPRAPSPDKRKTINRDSDVRAMLEQNANWYALMVPPQKEFTAELMLRDSGISAFVPIELRLKRVNPRIKKKVEVPYVLATRYVFAGFNGAVPWDKLYRAHLVSGIVGVGGQPTCIPQSIMRQLFDSSDGSGRKSSPQPLNRSVKVGDDVLITDGPFRGFTVNLKGLQGERAKVIISLFNSLQEMEIPVDWLEAC